MRMENEKLGGNYGFVGGDHEGDLLTVVFYPQNCLVKLLHFLKRGRIIQSTHQQESLTCSKVLVSQAGVFLLQMSKYIKYY
jgi:hypothetical protein